MPITDLAATSCRARSGEQLSCRDVMQAFLDAHRRGQPAHQRDRQPARRRRAARRSRRAATPSSARGADAAAVPVRPAAGDQGHRADRPASARTFGSPLLATHVPTHDALMVAAHEGGRLHRRRQDQHAGVRPRLAHLQRGLRRHPQRLRPDQVGRRQQRRRGRGAGDAHAAGRRRQRLRWAACATRPAGTTCSAFGRARVACRAWPAQDAWVTHFGTEGPMARNVLDLALLLDVQAGYDPRAPLSLATRAVVRRRRLDALDAARRVRDRLARRPRRLPRDGAGHRSTSARTRWRGSPASAAGSSRCRSASRPSASGTRGWSGAAGSSTGASRPT